MTNAQEWLDKYYPKDSRKTITSLEIDSSRLEDQLNLIDFPNLEELVIISDKKRNWEDFYNWLNDNIVDINEKGENKGNIKAAKRSKYPTLASNLTCIADLMNSLENNLGKTPLDYTGHNYQNAYKKSVLSYDDKKNFFQLANGRGKNFKYGYSFFDAPLHKQYLNEYENLLVEWRNSTNKTLIIKLEQIKAFQIQLAQKKVELTETKNKNTNLEQEKSSLQSQLTNQQEANENLKNQLVEKDQENKVLKNQVCSYERTNLEAFLVKKERELTETKKSIITFNNLNEDNQDELDNLLELQADFLQDNLPSLEKQLQKAKKRLSKLITNEEISLLCRLQTELIELQNQEQILEAKIEIIV